MMHLLAEGCILSCVIINWKDYRINFHYDKKTDLLYIELSTKPGFDAEEVAQGMIVDYDKDGRIVGLDIEDASKNFNLKHISIEGFSPLVDVQAKLNY